MKRLLFGVTLLCAVALLGGCPIYSDSGNYRVCNDSGCFDCPDTSFSSVCIPWQCQTSADCGGDSACTRAGICGPPSNGAPEAGGGLAACASPSDCPSGTTCGSDGTCHTGDCGGAVGCPGSFVCRVDNGQASCIPIGGQVPDASANGHPAPFDASFAPDSFAPDAAAPEAAGDAPSSIPEASVSVDGTVAETGGDSMPPHLDAARAADADATGDGSDSAAPDAAATLACNATSACGNAGAQCVNGKCTPQGALCSDATQCAVAGESCVDGLCTPKCSASAPCAAGFGCDFTRGVCSINPHACSTVADCQGATVCVEEHCAAPCATADSGAACPSGQACVNGGCIPDQHATFACLNEGEPGSLANVCDPADICLHGDCYVACATDAGSCAAGMACKQVTIAKGTFAVCAAPATLGSMCDPAATNAQCPTGMRCVDGYCS